ncbi:ras-related and estrogen-regulated growth inhibitor-like protein [Clytia hemisphaerica]|uniref:ras-related and estrogen-regulated growth inhibitor-like protein n=1 Tax=Clytia hemisphaerica TaxID=252671 RepID=UPI0034D56F89
MKTATMLNDLNGVSSSFSMEEKVARVVVLGRKGVGKTALVVRCLTKRFLPEYAPCHETYYKYRNRDLKKDGKELEMLIIDSDGQVKSITVPYLSSSIQNNDIYLNSEAFILVYSVTSRKSLESIEAIIRKIRILNRNEAAIIIVANQIDLIQKREVSTYDGVTMATKHQAEYYEVSVANDVEQVVELFNKVCQRIAVDTKNKTKTTQKIIDMFKRRGST